VGENFTPKQIASALRVSESSVKRWCDRGDIRTDRTVGGHRRIPLCFFLEFLESTNRRIADPLALGLEQIGNSREPIPSKENDASKLVDHFENSLISGSESDCRRIISSWYSTQGGVASLADDLLSPAFRSIGKKWQDGSLDVYQERHGCEISLKLILELRRLLSDPSGGAPLAMGGTPAGDHYQLPTLLSEMVLREQGWRTAGLGTNIPFASLLSAARTHMPRIFWLSISHIEDEEVFLNEYSEFAKRLPKGILLVVGGHALTESIRPKLVYSAHCDGMRHLAVLAKTLKAGPVVET
jgi:MerR family transcriptional regulator, light-induced transcriptional regulator